MGGEYWSAIVYGFEVPHEYVRLRDKEFKEIYIGKKGTGRYPVYYCIDLKSNKLDDVQQEISKLSEDNIKIMENFNKFAEKYGYKPCWQTICVGDIEVYVMSGTKNEVLSRLKKYELSSIENNTLYDENGNYSEDTIEDIELILHEEYMDFMGKAAIKTKTFAEIYDMIEEFYSIN